jgi:hypothetical protein
MADEGKHTTGQVEGMMDLYQIVSRQRPIGPSA